MHISNSIKKIVSPHYLVLILAVGYMLILAFAVKGCLPMTCFVDENVFTDQARSMLDNNFHPRSYNAPGLIQADILTLGLKMLGITSDRGTAIYILGRSLTVLTSAIGLLFVYLISHEIFNNKRIAILTSLIYAINPLLIHFSIIFRPDIFMTTFYLASLYMTLLFLRLKLTPLLALAGFFAGFAVSSKYPGLLVVIPTGTTLLAYAVIKKDLFGFISWMLLFGLSTILGLFLTSPFMFFESERVLEALKLESRSTHTGSDGLGFWGNLTWYIGRLFNSFGNILLILTGVNLFTLANKIKRSLPSTVSFQHFLIWSAAISFMISISLLKLHWTRWIVTVIPLLAIIVSPLVFQILHKLDKYHKPLAILAVLLLFFPPLFRSFVFINSMVIGDTRKIQIEWWESQNNAAEVLFDGYTGFKPRDSKGLDTEKLEEYKKSYDLLFTSSYTSRRYFENSGKFPAQTAFYSEIFTLPLVKTFNPSANNEDFQANSTNFSDFELFKRILINPDQFIGPYGPIIQVYRL